MNSIKEGHICRPPEEGLFLNFKFYFPGARHDGRAVFGGYEAAERAELLGGRGDRYTAGLLRNRGRRRGKRERGARGKFSGRQRTSVG